MRSKNLAAIFAGAFTLAMLSGTSAFADWRHPDATRGDNRSALQTDRRGDDSTQRSYDRGQRNDRRDNSAYRNDGRRSISAQGRVTRVEHFHDGYRVWLDRGGYPFFVPAARFRAFPIRVGVSIGLGGYWNPLGYYDVYDVGPYGGGYATAGDLQGVVESVDYRRGTAVLRDDISGSFVTIVLRGNDPRLGDLRPGDYVDLNGAWSRAGVFNAHGVADVRGRGYDRYDDRY